MKLLLCYEASPDLRGSKGEIAELFQVAYFEF